MFLFFLFCLVFLFCFVFSSKFQIGTPWRNDQNLIEPVLQERKKDSDLFSKRINPGSVGQELL